MSDADRKKWDAKYAAGAAPTEPSLLLTQLDNFLPSRGRALDVAGGAGRHAIWLARRGLDVTLADISPAGLEIARTRAAAVGVSLSTSLVDLERDPIPQGPWDLIVSFHFLWKPLFQRFPKVLRPGGLLVVVQPTRSNLQRHDKPPVRYLLDDGELPTLVEQLEVIHYREGWLDEGRHDALVVARRAKRDQ